MLCCSQVMRRAIHFTYTLHTIYVILIEKFTNNSNYLVIIYSLIISVFLVYQKWNVVKFLLAG